MNVEGDLVSLILLFFTGLIVSFIAIHKLQEPREKSSFGLIMTAVIGPVLMIVSMIGSLFI